MLLSVILQLQLEGLFSGKLTNTSITESKYYREPKRNMIMISFGWAYIEGFD